MQNEPNTDLQQDTEGKQAKKVWETPRLIRLENQEAEGASGGNFDGAGYVS